MVVVVLVHLFIQLQDVSKERALPSKSGSTNQIENRHFHHTLVKVCGPVLDNLYRNHLLRPEILAFDNLPESPLAQHVENKIAILMARFFGSEDIVDIEYVIAVLVVIAIVPNAFARFRENSAWVPRRFVLEAGIAYPVRRGQMCS